MRRLSKYLYSILPNALLRIGDSKGLLLGLADISFLAFMTSPTSLTVVVLFTWETLIYVHLHTMTANHLVLKRG